MFVTAEERRLKKEAKRAKKEEEEAKQREWEKQFTEKKRSKDKEKSEFFLQQKELEESKKNSREMNQAKYEIWGTKDAKGKMLIDRYNLHDKEKAQQKKEERAKELAALYTSPHIEQKKNRPSEYMKGNTAIHLPEPKVYTPSPSAPHLSDPVLSSSSAPAISSLRASTSAVPEPTAFSNSTVTLIHKNNVCYWPVQMVTEENLIERFLMKKPALRLANIPKGPLAVKIKPVDGRFLIQPGASYVVFNLKDKKTSLQELNPNSTCELTYEQKVLKFLTLEKFSRGEILTGMGSEKMVREEVFKFTADGKFVYKEFKGYKAVPGSMKEVGTLKGTYKFKSKTSRIKLKFIEEKLKNGKKKAPVDKNRTQDKMVEKKRIYTTWVIPGDGSIQCVSEPTIKFK